MHLGPYEVVRSLGKGTFGEVHLARATTSSGVERLVAIKRLMDAVAGDTQLVERFSIEARICGYLNHPNIVRVHNFVPSAEGYLLVMEYLEGVDLRRLSRAFRQAGRVIPLADAVELMAQLCEGLHFAHLATGPDGRPLGLVHRDIKPGNLMLVASGQLKIMDFGVARADFARTRTAMRSIKGTLMYMAPEQARGDVLGPGADQFATGLILAELLLGRPVYQASQEGQLIYQVISAAVDEALAPLKAHLPSLHAVVKQALAANPADRYPDQGAMARALRAVLLDLSTEPSLGVLARGMLQDPEYALKAGRIPPWQVAPQDADEAELDRFRALVSGLSRDEPPAWTLDQSVLGLPEEGPPTQVMADVRSPDLELPPPPAGEAARMSRQLEQVARVLPELAGLAGSGERLAARRVEAAGLELEPALQLVESDENKEEMGPTASLERVDSPKGADASAPEKTATGTVSLNGVPTDQTSKAGLSATGPGEATGGTRPPVSRMAWVGVGLGLLVGAGLGGYAYVSRLSAPGTATVASSRPAEGLAPAGHEPATGAVPPGSLSAPGTGLEHTVKTGELALSAGSGSGVLALVGAGSGVVLSSGTRPEDGNSGSGQPGVANASSPIPALTPPSPPVETPSVAVRPTPEPKPARARATPRPAPEETAAGDVGEGFLRFRTRPANLKLYFNSREVSIECFGTCVMPAGTLEMQIGAADGPLDKISVTIQAGKTSMYLYDAAMTPPLKLMSVR